MSILLVPNTLMMWTLFWDMMVDSTGPPHKESRPCLEYGSLNFHQCLESNARTFHFKFPENCYLKVHTGSNVMNLIYHQNSHLVVHFLHKAINLTVASIVSPKTDCLVVSSGYNIEFPDAVSFSSSLMDTLHRQAPVSK